MLILDQEILELRSSSNYQDYVIKDGKFIGAFEQMYQDVEDPWGQTSPSYYTSPSKLFLCDSIKTANINSIVEFGCGLGSTASYIAEMTGISVTGIDLSSTAICSAKKRHPDIEFQVDDVRNIRNYTKYECIVWSELTWYVLENQSIDNIFMDMQKLFKGKYFAHNLVFYKDHIQKYGRDYFTNLTEFIDFCPFTCLELFESDHEDKDVIETSTMFKI